MNITCVCQGVVYAFLYVSLYPVLIYLIGDMGAAISYVLIFLFSAIYSLVRLRGVSKVLLPGKELLAITCLSVILLVPLLFDSFPRFIVFFLSLAVWAGLLWFANLLGKKEITHLKLFLKALIGKN